ncbi:hypothetical protein FHE72_16915 [Rossellomorea vietnamensis]|uniref:Uncharacterized protein n=1 Tax=Rossellomorea vietnamensis TaxID=218284 RepID=A0A6I6UHS6_9BACI|nr:hypothetical protein [Rossellomorea vietnamensis]QHE62514.1 hypothetical protein FHE72_16915 [Rossellomorea vietnamensis]
MFTIKKAILLTVFTLITILAACSNQPTFEEFFHKEMKENAKEYDKAVNYSYSLIHKEEEVIEPNDAIAVFTEHNPRGEQVFIAYFKQEDGQWEWKQTRGAEWNTPVKWSAMHQEPYIYSGAISDSSIKQVFAGREKANIIEVEGDKRFWYAVSDTKDAEVKVVKEDGTQEVIEELDDKELEESSEQFHNR